jgi:ketosteroid isomerase-like protein
LESRSHPHSCGKIDLLACAAETQAHQLAGNGANLRDQVADMGIVEEEIIRLSGFVSAAEKRKDAGVVASYLAADYVGIDPSGDLLDKAMLVGRYRAGEFNLDTLTLSDIAVRAHQDSAWEFGTMELAGNLGERKFAGKYRYSHFWIRSGSSWLIAASQMTPVQPQSA